MENKKCPYCGQILSIRQFNHHVKNCFKNPIYNEKVEKTY